MVAWVEVTVVLNDGIASAGLREDAGAWLKPAPVSQCGIELVHEILPHVIADPVIEYVA